MLIGERIRDERIRLGYNQSDFAAMGGASKRSQTDWERGVAYPNAQYLALIAEAGADVLYILTGQRKAVFRMGSVVEAARARGLLPGQALAGPAQGIQEERGMYLAADEVELLQAYHDLPAEARDVVRTLLRYMKHE